MPILVDLCLFIIQNSLCITFIHSAIKCSNHIQSGMPYTFHHLGIKGAYLSLRKVTDVTIEFIPLSAELFCATPN